MRATRFLIVAATTAAGVVALGCHQDKHHLAPPVVEEYQLPPHEPRFDNPPTEEYKKPPLKKDEKTLLGDRNRNKGGPVSPGGF